jgi:hypothetical protein
MEKKKYIIPTIELIILDNEISLALNSTPPEGPEETTFLKNSNNFINNNPYNNFS